MRHISRVENEPLYIGPDDGALVEKRVSSKKPTQHRFRFIPSTDETKVIPLSSILKKYPDGRLARQTFDFIQYALNREKEGLLQLQQLQIDVNAMVTHVLSSKVALSFPSPEDGQYSFEPRESFCVITPKIFGTFHTRVDRGVASIYADLPEHYPLVRGEVLEPWITRKKEVVEPDVLQREIPDLPDTIGNAARQTTEDIRKILKLFRLATPTV